MYRDATITQLNDQLRKHGIGGKMFMTSGIQSLEAWHREAVINAVREFDDFTTDNDPHGEHDLGFVVVSGTKVMWKIGYFDPTMSHASEDPRDNKKTLRVVMIMLAEEY